MIKTPVLIIGGGLSGLTLHYLLRKEGIDGIILEARERVGGRIVTATDDGGPTVDLGATWLGPAHKHLQELLTELGLERVEQYMGDKAIYEPNSMTPHQLVTLPAGQEPSWRIKGGTSVLIQTLENKGGAGSVHTSRQVQKITEKDDTLLVFTNGAEYEADIVISALPPKLLLERVEFEPALPEEISEIMNYTHTWMGESVKFGLSYDHPFWRDKQSSGTVFSNSGPITEMYDHSDAEGTRFALMGFLNSSYFSLTREERLQKVLKQMRSYYGNIAEGYRSYHELVWPDEEFTYHPYDRHVLPHQNNGHEVFQESWLNGKFYLAGAETSSISPGYMDGAIVSARRVFNQLKQKF